MLKSPFLWAILPFFFLASSAEAPFQNDNGGDCGSVVTPETRSFMRSLRPNIRSFDRSMPRGIRDFPVVAHVVRRNNGLGGFNKQQLETALQKVNQHFIGANIRFIIDDINFINSDYHYDFNTANESSFCGSRDHKDVINVYFFNSVSRSSGGGICGYAYLANSHSSSGSPNRIVMDNSCSLNGSTLSHEFGHFFSLYHTHSDDEFVNGSNCRTAGDEVCDTPADPGLSGKVNGDCSYFGSRRDPNGHTYRPDTKNLMSYSMKSCRQYFSAQQLARINYAALNFRSYIKFPQKPKPPSNQPPKAWKLSGELELEIEGQRIPTRLDGNLYKGTRSYSAGTNYQLFINNEQQAYVYVFGSDLTKKTSLLFPTGSQSALLANQHSRFALPSSYQMFQLDDTRGKDYICILYSKKALNMDFILKQMEQLSGTFTQRLYKTLGSFVVPAHAIDYSKTGALKFSAITSDKYIVPIMVEFDHI